MTEKNNMSPKPKFAHLDVPARSVIEGARRTARDRSTENGPKESELKIVILRGNGLVGNEPCALCGENFGVRGGKIHLWMVEGSALRGHVCGGCSWVHDPAISALYTALDWAEPDGSPTMALVCLGGALGELDGVQP